MKKINYTILLTIQFILVMTVVKTSIPAQQPIIIDHSCTDIHEIPVQWIDSARANLFIGYGHTSHGSQLISGMNAIESYFTDGTFNWSHSGGEGELHLFEGAEYEEGYLELDCGYSGWDNQTREFLDSFPACNVIIWSWCGQVNDVDLASHYLGPMEQLESEYPYVKFIYMTGHLEGLGPEGSVYAANQQIRDYCNANNKILFDFADIEKYKPYNDTNYQAYFADDGCYYNHPQGGQRNWAEEWLSANTSHELTQISELCGSCAHSKSLNCVKKGIACWYMWARIAGWDNGDVTTGVLYHRDAISLYPNPAGDYFTVALPEETEGAILEITDLQGRPVFTNNINRGTKKIIITDLNIAAGIYILRINTGYYFYTAKLLKQ
jgi:hypothetical protein